MKINHEKQNVAPIKIKKTNDEDKVKKRVVFSNIANSNSERIEVSFWNNYTLLKATIRKSIPSKKETTQDVQQFFLTFCSKLR